MDLSCFSACSARSSLLILISTITFIAALKITTMLTTQVVWSSAVVSAGHCSSALSRGSMRSACAVFNFTPVSMGLSRSWPHSASRGSLRFSIIESDDLHSVRSTRPPYLMPAHSPSTLLASGFARRPSAYQIKSLGLTLSRRADSFKSGCGRRLG